MFDIDFIIPCYGKSDLINKGIASLVTQWKNEYIHVTLVNDCSPNTDCNYQDLVDRYKDVLDIRCIKTPENYGQGLARQYGIDHTNHDYFMFMDEDDLIGNGVAISVFVGAVECANIKFNPDGSTYSIDENGKPLQIDDPKEVAVVSGPLFEFDDNHTKIIDNNNHVWLNSKLFNRKFIEKHNIRFNTAQSRHAEDYFFTSCFFFCLDHDPEYKGIILDNNGLYYIWYPNPESQSRIDPHYAYMLAGYTMNGSVNILKYMKNTNVNKLVWNDNIAEDYRKRLFNMTIYSFFNLLSFIRHVATTDYKPKLEKDWYILRDSCNELREMLSADYDTKYSYTEKIEEYYHVKNFSDVEYTEPWISLDDYVINGCDELTWDYNQLIESKTKYKFNKFGVRIWD